MLAGWLDFVAVWFDGLFLGSRTVFLIQGPCELLQALQVIPRDPQVRHIDGGQDMRLRDQPGQDGLQEGNKVGGAAEKHRSTASALIFIYFLSLGPQWSSSSVLGSDP